MNRVIQIIQFYYKAFRGIIRKQCLHLPEKKLHFSGDFQLNLQDKVEWLKLFGVSDDKLHIPFTYFWPLTIQHIMSTINHLQINFRNIFHLYQKFTIDDIQHIDSFEEMEFTTDIKDIVVYKRRSAIVMLTGTLKSKQGSLIAHCYGEMIITNLNKSDFNKLSHSEIYNNNDIAHLDRFTHRKPKLVGSSMRKGYIYIPQDFAVSFGKVSGDRNPVHSHSHIATIFGFPKAFIQGMATLNLAIKFLCCEYNKQIKKIEITFVKPIFTDQQIQIISKDNKYEIIDSCGKLTSFGTYGE